MFAEAEVEPEFDVNDEADSWERVSHDNITKSKQDNKRFVLPFTYLIACKASLQNSIPLISCIKK